ncbi:MAG: histidine kinase [Flavobacteriales bacterium]|nr:histidine kinase [Flavobacteriales bacterium]
MKFWITLFGIISVISIWTQEKDSLLDIISTSDDGDTNKVHALVDLAAIHYHDNLDTSKILVLEALHFAMHQDYTRGIGFSNTAMSGYFFQKGDFDSALVYANKGVEILESIKDKQHILAAYNNIALIYNNMDKPEEAIKIYLKIYSLIEQNNPSVQHMAICNNLAIAYGNNHQPEESKTWFSKVVNYAEEMESPMGLVYGYNGISIVNIELEEYDEAIDNASKALQIGLENGMDKTVLESYQNLGTSFLKKKNYNKAVEHFNEGKLLAEKIGAKRNLEVIYKGLSDLYLKQQKFELAYEFNDKFHAIKDSIFTEDKVALIEELEKKYETAELKSKQAQLELEKEQLTKEAELEAIKNMQLSQEKELEALRAKRNQNYLITSIVIALILASAGLLYFLQFKKRKQSEFKQIELDEQNKRLMVENQYKDAELKAIKAQMNPHFMFNALNSIQEYIIFNEKELASDYLGKFADLMRLYLNQSNQNLIKIEDEIKSLHLYIELEALRQEDLSFAIKCEDDFLMEKKLPPMLIQPYVENAIKHGLWHKKSNKKLKILFYEKNELIVCEVIDNGVGLVESKRIQDQKGNHQSFSTAANENRIKIIQEKHGNKLNITIEELKEGELVLGTRVEIQIPNNLS